MKSTSITALDRLNKLTLLGTTALVASFGMMTQTSHAQDNTTQLEEVDEVVTTGIRKSLKDARDLKRDADTAIDSITASDVGALPDLSVAEALARVPGVVVQRFDISSNNGGDFPSPEGGGNLIRGLTLVRSEYNGRDAFSANGGRSLDFGTVPPELIGAVDVYKNTSADLIEGGIGGTINLRSLEPFDRDGLTAVVSVDGTYTDLRDEWAPDYSVLLGNRWDTDAGEFGLMGSFSSSELKSDLHGFQIGQLIPFATDTGTIAVPGGFQLRTNDVDRERDSYYLAGQWRNPEGTLQLTGKYSLIKNKVDGNERTVEWFANGEQWNQLEIRPSFLDGDFTTAPFTSSGIPQCNGTNGADVLCEITQSVDGILDQGIVSNNLRDWTGADGADFTNLGINQTDRSQTDDLSLNIKWRPSDRLYVNLDGHKTSAEFTRDRLWAGSRFFSDFTLNADLNNPQVSLIPTPGSNPSGFTRGDIGVTGTGDISDPANAYLLFLADEFQDNEGDMYALRGDVEYEFDNDGWFESIKFGARFADRDQTNRAAGLNWAAVAPAWAGGYLPYASVAEAPESVDFSDFQRGGVVTGSNTNVLFPNRDLIQNYDAFVASLDANSLISQRVDDNGDVFYGDWGPLNQNGGVDYLRRGTVGEITEKTQSYYARLDFGNEFENGMSLEGNAGVRYTKTNVDSTGQFAYAQNESPDDNQLQFAPETLAFLAQDDIRLDQSSSDDRWLPSLNLKLNVTDNFLVRFAASEAITRPNVSQLRVEQTASVAQQFIVDRDAVIPGVEGSGVVGINPTGVNIFGGNPNLKPIESTNLDLSFESYYGDDNSLTFSLFHKDIRNNIFYAQETIGTETLDGLEVPVIFNGDLNQDEATVKGFEVAGQHFFDNLPGLLSNLGVQANYTYIDAKTNAPEAVAEDNPLFDFQRIFRYNVEDYLGLSDHTANLIGIYQDEKLEMRLAYNWRSEYLSSYRDFVTGNPIYQQPTGYLDGSIKYDFNENFQVRAQIANITNERANAEQQIDASGQRFGRTSFIGDRRIKVGARYQF